MKVTDVIIELLETGKMIYRKNYSDIVAISFGSEEDAIKRIVDLINQMTGYNRSDVIYDYFEGKINRKNALFRLVVDEPKEPLTNSLTMVVIPDSQSSGAAEEISIQRKRGRKYIYNEHSCIEALRKASESLGAGFSKTSYINFTRTQKGLPSASTITKHVGKNASSWSLILSYAGISRNALKVTK